MPQVTLRINGKDHTLDVPEDMPLLWALRDKLNMTGTKYSVRHRPVRHVARFWWMASRSNPAGALRSTWWARKSPLSKAWIRPASTRCRKPGTNWMCRNAVTARAARCWLPAALLEKNPEPDDAAIDEAMSDNLCRCGTYMRIRKAVKLAAELQADKGGAA